jgi:hypothetical protein
MMLIRFPDYIKRNEVSMRLLFAFAFVPLGSLYALTIGSLSEYRWATTGPSSWIFDDMRFDRSAIKTATFADGRIVEMVFYNDDRVPEDGARICVGISRSNPLFGSMWVSDWFCGFD